MITFKSRKYNLWLVCYRLVKITEIMFYWWATSRLNKQLMFFNLLWLVQNVCKINKHKSNKILIIYLCDWIWVKFVCLWIFIFWLVVDKQKIAYYNTKHKILIKIFLHIYEYSLKLILIRSFHHTKHFYNFTVNWCTIKHQ